MKEGYDLYRRYMREAKHYANYYKIDPATSSGGAADAFRHAYASGAMRMEVGECPACFFGILNELYGDVFNGQSEFDRNMDLWNNAVGRALGEYVFNKDQLARAVYEAMQRGELITDAQSDPRRYPDISGYDHLRTRINIKTDPGIVDGLGLDDVGGQTDWDAVTPSPLTLDGGGDETKSLLDESIIWFDHHTYVVNKGAERIKPDDGPLVPDRGGNEIIESRFDLSDVDGSKRNAAGFSVLQRSADVQDLDEDGHYLSVGNVVGNGRADGDQWTEGRVGRASKMYEWGTSEVRRDSGSIAIGGKYTDSSYSVHRVRFLDVSSGDVSSLERRGTELVMTYGVGVELTIRDYFYLESTMFYPRVLVKFDFSDDVSWGDEEIETRIVMDVGGEKILIWVVMMLVLTRMG